jgi:hypothetical protein
MRGDPGEFRAKSCQKKRRYATSSEAEDTARHRREESGEKDLEIYPCRFCGGWHIGHPLRPRKRFL